MVVKCHICLKLASCTKCTGYQKGFHEELQNNDYPVSVRIKAGTGLLYVHICSEICLKKYYKFPHDTLKK